MHHNVFFCPSFYLGYELSSTDTNLLKKIKVVVKKKLKGAQKLLTMKSWFPNT